MYLLTKNYRFLTFLDEKNPFVGKLKLTFTKSGNFHAMYIKMQYFSFMGVVTY